MSTSKERELVRKAAKLVVMINALPEQNDPATNRLLASAQQLVVQIETDIDQLGEQGSNSGNSLLHWGEALGRISSSVSKVIEILLRLSGR